MRVYDQELKEVKQYMERASRRRAFELFQSEVKNGVEEVIRDPNLFHLALSVMTRADCDPLQPIKSDKKIALKLHKWRKSDPSTATQDIHDIAGVTILCNFPSDTDRLAEHFDELDKPKYKFNRFRFIDPSQSGGYRAYHGIVKGKGEFQNLTCEIQIKTQLTMAWGSKTHDLTYKPIGDVDKRLTTQMEKLIVIAQNLDEQSEIIKDLISEARELESMRREIAGKQIVLNWLDLENNDILELIGKIQGNEQAISFSRLEGAPQEIINMIDGYVESHGYDIHICRVACYLALCRNFDDLNDWALDIIDAWISNSAPHDGDSAKQLLRPLFFRSGTCFALGEFEEAIEVARSCLREALELGEPRYIALAKGNLVYYLSEAYYHRAFDEASGQGETDATATENCKNEALDLIQYFKDNRAEFTELQVEDSFGSAIIICGENESDIQFGLTICKSAFEKMMEDNNGELTEVFIKSFYDLHEKRAYRRIISFTPNL